MMPPIPAWRLDHYRVTCPELLARFEAERKKVQRLEEALRRSANRTDEGRLCWCSYGPCQNDYCAANRALLASPAPDRPEGEEEWPSDMDPRRSPAHGPCHRKDSRMTTEQKAEGGERPVEEDERRMLIWLMDVRTNGGPLDRRFAKTTIDTLAWFEAALQASREEIRQEQAARARCIERAKRAEARSAALELMLEQQGERLRALASPAPDRPEGEA